MKNQKMGIALMFLDLPGCTSAGADQDEIQKNIIEAIKLHLEVMVEGIIEYFAGGD